MLHSKSENINSNECHVILKQPEKKYGVQTSNISSEYSVHILSHDTGCQTSNDQLQLESEINLNTMNIHDTNCSINE